MDASGCALTRKCQTRNLPLQGGLHHRLSKGPAQTLAALPLPIPKDLNLLCGLVVYRVLHLAQDLVHGDRGLTLWLGHTLGVRLLSGVPLDVLLLPSVSPPGVLTYVPTSTPCLACSTKSVRHPIWMADRGGSKREG